MKRTIVGFAWFIAISTVILIVLAIIIRIDDIAEHFMNILENRQGQLTDIEIISLGCCAENIKVREYALLGANSITQASGDFIMTLSSDKRIYAQGDIISIWGTLEYIGEKEEIEIWHGCPLIVFGISDGAGFSIGNDIVDILSSSVLERGRVYHFNFEDSRLENAPPGEHIISLNGVLSLTEPVLGLTSELVIIIE